MRTTGRCALVASACLALAIHVGDAAAQQRSRNARVSVAVVQSAIPRAMVDSVVSQAPAPTTLPRPTWTNGARIVVHDRVAREGRSSTAHPALRPRIIRTVTVEYAGN